MFPVFPSPYFSTTVDILGIQQMQGAIFANFLPANTRFRCVCKLFAIYPHGVVSQARQRARISDILNRRCVTKECIGPGISLEDASILCTALGGDPPPVLVVDPLSLLLLLPKATVQILRLLRVVLYIQDSWV